MKRILWVEDEGKLELIQYKTPLIRGGYRVDIACDATEAIQLLKEKAHDAIIIDLFIPCGNEFETHNYCIGLELLKRLIDGKINGLGKYPPSWIMIFTAINSPDIEKEIRKLGVKTILGKRLNELDDLKKCVDGLFMEG